LLLDAQPRFLKEWNAYVLELRNSSAGAQERTDNEAELAIDMHCKAPQDVTVSKMPDGRVQYAIDVWRVTVNESVLILAASNDISNTLAGINASIQKIPAESRDLYVADFNRDCAHAQLPFYAIKKPDGLLHVDSTK
jgi:hypothetical protein